MSGFSRSPGLANSRRDCYLCGIVGETGIQTQGDASRVAQRPCLYLPCSRGAGHPGHIVDPGILVNIIYQLARCHLLGL